MRCARTLRDAVGVHLEFSLSAGRPECICVNTTHNGHIGFAGTVQKHWRFVSGDSIFFNFARHLTHSETLIQWKFLEKISPRHSDGDAALCVFTT